MLEGNTAVTATPPIDASVSADNLIQNLGRRGSSSTQAALIQHSTPYFQTQETCYKTNNSKAAPYGHIVTIRFDLGRSFFQHAILIVEDLRDTYGYPGEDASQTNNFFQNFEVFIGEDLDYIKNVKCAGGPHKVVGDPASYTNVSWDVAIPPNTGNNGNVWNYGKEIWCNLQGRYMTIVADYSHLESQSYQVSLCSVGIMGTEYGADIQVPNALTV